ncbi:MAG: hypothetical protein HY650_10640 [Acidobacteria bacterium]|nr:hypothetical protein [Acidobacteriota bacterium]
MAETKVSAIRLFFAFPDGVYDYVCAECTALCCKGHGFAGNLKRGLGELITLYPSLQSMAIAREGNIMIFTTPASGCPLLDVDNRCLIEKELGKSRKPGLCELFPFNLFTRIGDAIAVSPHFLCPLRIVVPARPGEVEGSHSRLEVTLRNSGFLEETDFDPSLTATLLHPSQKATSVLKREEKFRDVCGQALGSERFGDTLMGQSENPEEYESVLYRVIKVMGLEMPPRSPKSDGLDDLMLALAPPLRLKLLRLSSEAILRALALSEIVVRRIACLSRVPLTPQGAYNILKNLRPGIRLLAHGDEPIEHSSNVADKSAPFGDPELTFGAFTVLRHVRASMGVLSALERSISPTLSIADRSVLFVQLGHQLDHTQAPRREKGAREKAGAQMPTLLGGTEGV